SFALDEKHGLTETLGEAVMRPTKIYANQIKAVMEEITIKGISHITGGGFYENIPRIMPEGLGVELDECTWKVPEVFSFIQAKGNMTKEEMYGVFNMGVGMALVVAKEDVEATLAVFEEMNETANVIGKVINEEGVHFV